MNSIQQRAAISRYQNARVRYFNRLKDLGTARTTPDYEYKPPWEPFTQEVFGGHNIVDPTRVEPKLESPELGIFATKYKIVADDWFRMILIVESMRFVGESNLSSLLRRP